MPQIGDTCFRVSAVPMIYEDANAKCELEGASLASIFSQDIQYGLAGLIDYKLEHLNSFKNVDRLFWIGGRYLNEKWMWQFWPLKDMKNFQNWLSVPGKTKNQVSTE